MLSRSILSPVTDFQAQVEGLLGPRNIFYVSSQNQPKNTGHHFKTLRAALDACKPYRGDIIVVRALHSETLNPTNVADFNVDKAGVTIIGEGAPGMQPVFYWGDADKSITITAPSVTLQNLTFVNTVDNLAVFIDVVARGFSLIDCILTSRFHTEVLVFVQSTDVSVTNGSSDDPWTTWTTASGGLGSWMVGQSAEFTAGTNVTTGRYTITAVDGATSLTIADAAGDTAAITNASISVSNCADMLIKGCQFIQDTKGTAAATECIELAGMGENVAILDNYIRGEWTVAAISLITLKSYNTRIDGNTIINIDAAGLAVDVLAACTGSFANNRIHCPTASDVDSLAANESYRTASLALSGVLDPATV